MAQPGERPRVADLIPRVQLRGAEIFAQHLQAALRDRYEARLFALYGEPLRPAPVDGPALSISPGAGRSGLARAAWGLRGRVRAFRPDVIVAHGGDPLRAAALAGLQGIAPLVYVRVAAVTPDLRTPARSRSLRWAYGKVRAFVAVSDSLRQELIDVFEIEPERIRVIRNGRRPPLSLSDDERASLRREVGVADGEVFVAWVGRFVTEKDPLAAVDLADRLATLAPEARLVMVGGGPLAADVRAAAQDVPNLTLAGIRDDAPRLIAAADLLVSTSRTEGAPGVFVEALLAGVPVIARDMGGVRDVVDDETGILVPAADPESLARAVASLVTDPDARARKALQAKGHGERFHIAGIADDYDELYRELRESQM